MDQALSTIRQVLKIVGLVVACLALAKLAGVGMPIRASIIELAAVDALAHA